MIDLLFHVFIVLSFTLSALYYQELILGILAVLFLSIIFKKSVKLGIIVLIIVFLSASYFNSTIKPPIINNAQFTITKVNKYDYYAKNKQGIILLKTDVKLNKGDVVKINNSLKPVSKLVNLGLFDMKTYLLSKRIHYEAFEKKPIIIKKIYLANESRKNKINNYFDYLFLMKKDNFDSDIGNTLMELAIIHLVIVSGFHFNFFYKILNVLLFFIKRSIIKKIIILSLLFYYLFLLDFSYPSLRAFLFMLLSNVTLFDKLNNLTKLSLIGIGILLINPLAILSNSFVLTFFVSFTLLFLPKEITRLSIFKNLTIFLATIPFIASFNYQISILSFLYQIFFLPIITILYIVVFVGNFITFFEAFALFIINFFESLLSFINNYNIVWNVGYLTPLTSIIYLFIFFISLHFIKKSKLFISLPIVLVCYFTFIPTANGFVTFLNVGQGDCIIIKPPFSFDVMMIDVAKPYKQETVKNIVIPYLKANRIKKISKLVITHQDIDHSGGKDDLMKSFKVDAVIEKKQRIIKFNSYTFIDLLAGVQFKDKNTNSISLYTRINGLNYLFTGDISKDAELEYLKYVKKLPVDILKVAHHGSKTSTSQLFLELTNPTIAIISAKKNNSYGHPHQEVVERLNLWKSSIYSTANNGSITIYNNFLFNYLKKYQ